MKITIHDRFGRGYGWWYWSFELCGETITRGNYKTAQGAKIGARRWINSAGKVLAGVNSQLYPDSIEWEVVE